MVLYVLRCVVSYRYYKPRVRVRYVGERLVARGTIGIVVLPELRPVSGGNFRLGPRTRHQRRDSFPLMFPAGRGWEDCW